MAKEVLIAALNKFPMLWSAWLELCSFMDSSDRSLLRGVRQHWMRNFFLANFYLEIHQERECIELNTFLLRHFPNNVYILNQIAHASYTS